MCGGGGAALADGGREGAGGGREGAEGGREGGGSQGGGGVGPCTQVEAFKWPKCAPPVAVDQLQSFSRLS